MVLGEAIKSVRIFLELTQEQVANKASISQGFYSGIESGVSTPSIESLQKIADALEVPMFWLICKATQQQDIPKNKRGVYNSIKPTLNDILQEILEIK